MFGEEYFKTRKRLTDVVSGVIELADKTEAEKTPLLDHDITKGLSNPFLLVVCGEVNAGKSTLLNGLFGQDVCKTNVLPETDRVQWYRYGEDDYNEEVTPILEERFRSIDFLMDFNLVDTPGTNSVVRGHQAITERFLPVADLIFWVFPASNPWGASTWDFIGKQDQEMVEKSIFILQQADLREESDLEVILGHMRDITEKRIGRILPIYPVSGKLAMQSKMETPFGENSWRESGYPKLEKYISEVVTDSPSRREVLGRVRDAAGEVLRSIEDMIAMRTRQLGENEGFLNHIESEMDRDREKLSSDVTVKFISMRDAFVRQVGESKKLMRRKTGFWGTLLSMFRSDNLPQVVVQSLIDSVQEAVEDQADEDALQLVSQCRAHWETVRPRVKRQMSISLAAFDEEADGFDITKQRFVRRMGRAAKQAVVNLKIRGMLDMKLTERRSSLKVWVYIFLMLLLSGGVAGSLKIDPYPYPALVFLGGAILALLVFVFQVYRTRKHLLEAFADQLDDFKDRFAEALARDYRDGVRDFYIEYASLMESVRQYISDAKLELQPNLEQWNSLFLELKEIEQEL